MKPPARERTEFEKVKVDEWIAGDIAEVQYDKAHEFTFKGEKKINPGVRFKFSLEGYNFPHYSRWMTFSYGEKSNLYRKYLFCLVDGAKPDMDFDLDELKGFPIKTMWSNNDDFQNLEMIRPQGAMLKPEGQRQVPAGNGKNADAEYDIPF